MKFARTIRFDSSDDRVFERVAGPDEWAVSGGFAFAGLSPDRVAGKTRQAFANGFLSLDSFGRSTFVCVAEADAGIETACVEALAAHLVERYGAPGMDAARSAAREEVGFMGSLCADAPVNTVLAVSRRFDEAGGIREEFRSVAPPGEGSHARVWDVVDE